MPRHKRFNPLVRPRLNATGKITSWFVDAGMIDGRRVRFAFATKAQAHAKADEMKLAHRQHGDSILNDSVTNHPDVAAALELLKPYQATLVEAARFYVKNSNVIRDRRKVEDVKAELLQSKGQDSRSARYLKDLGQKLSAFVDDFAGRPIHEITTPELDRCTRSLNVSGTGKPV
jgi:hypothetical protein